MATSKERKDRLKNISDRNAAETDALLEADLTALKSMTRASIDALVPKTTSKEVYDKLVSIVEDASRGNVSIANFHNNLKNAGDEVMNLAKLILGKVKGL